MSSSARRTGSSSRCGKASASSRPSPAPASSRRSAATSLRSSTPRRSWARLRRSSCSRSRSRPWPRARTKVLRELTIGLCTALAVIGFCETLVFAIVIDGLHRHTAFVGVLDTFQGVGAIAGGVTAAALMRAIGDIHVAGLGLAAFGVACFGFLVPSLGGVLPSMVVFGAGVAWLVVACSTAFQLRSPQVMQGRVAAASNMLFSVPQTTSIALGAALITIIDYRIEIVIMAVVTLMAAAYLLTRSETRGLVADTAKT